LIPDTSQELSDVFSSIINYDTSRALLDTWELLLITDALQVSLIIDASQVLLDTSQVLLIIDALQVSLIIFEYH